MNDDCHDVDNDGENVDDAMGSVHDGDDNNAAMGHPSHCPTNQTLSPILPTELTKQMVLRRLVTTLLLALLIVPMTASGL
uniref:Uncharacterized protein n=1 Tax=Loa loa TaxID=7209 RepID=A0A1I7W491_LOALO